MARIRPDTLEFRQAAVGMVVSQGAPTWDAAYRLEVAQELGMSTEPSSHGWLVALGEAIERVWKEAHKQAANRS